MQVFRLSYMNEKDTSLPYLLKTIAYKKLYWSASFDRLEQSDFTIPHAFSPLHCAGLVWSSCLKNKTKAYLLLPLCLDFLDIKENRAVKVRDFGLNIEILDLIMDWRIADLRIFHSTTSRSSKLITKADLKWECPYFYSNFF